MNQDPTRVPETAEAPTYRPEPPHVVRPPTAERESRALARWVSGVIKLVGAIGALAGAGATGGWTSHFLSEYRLGQIELRVQDHLKQAELDKASHIATHVQLERELQDLRLDYGVKLAELRSGVDDIKDGLRRIENKLDGAEPRPRYQPRNPPR